ncbi:MAG TPA: hypothetical protein PKC30_03590 [Saprospiraceae bacterium]|nr:hypothetical protein [Saprospiraceae bacterium]
MKVLLCGVGGPTPIGMAKSLRFKYPDINLIGADGNRFAPGLYRENLFNKCILTPYTRQQDYWAVLEKVIEKEKIDFAFIVPETEVLAWSQRMMDHQLPCLSLIPDFEVATFIFNKKDLAEFLYEKDLSAKTVSINHPKKDEIVALGNILKYPYWVRLNKTAGALGAMKIHHSGDLQPWLKMFPGNADFIASEYLPGRNYACKLLYIHGELILGAAAERIEYLLPNLSPTKITGMCARGRLLNNHELLHRAHRAMTLIYHRFEKPIHGMFTVDMKENKNGVPMITEINLRHVSFTHAFSLAGANFAFETLEYFYYNKPSGSPILHTFEEEYHFIRGVDSELFIVRDTDLL